MQARMVEVRSLVQEVMDEQGMEPDSELSDQGVFAVQQKAVKAQNQSQALDQNAGIQESKIQKEEILRPEILRPVPYPFR